MLVRIKRLVKHRWLGPSSSHRAIAPDMLKRLQQQVAVSERRHSGEVRIYVEASLPLSYLWNKASMRQIVRQRALTLFGKLRVWDTAHNNGVLIYLLLAERAIEVVADRGIHERVDPKVWQAMVSGMSAAFKGGHFEQGLAQALEQVSAQLVRHFPLAAGDVNPNELPDAPVLR